MTRLEAARLGAIARAQLARIHGRTEQLALLPGRYNDALASKTDWLKWETYKGEIARKFALVVDTPWNWRAWWQAGATTLAKEAARLKRHEHYRGPEWTT